EWDPGPAPVAAQSPGWPARHDDGHRGLRIGAYRTSGESMNDLQPQRRHRPTKAMILAAGEGRRLRPFTDALPKCMIPVAGKPVLEHAIEHLLHYRVRQVIVNVSLLAGVIRE